MNMRAQPKLINLRLGAPFFVAPGNGRLPSLRQWIYLLVGATLLLTAERPYFRLVTSRGLIATGQQFTTDLVQDCLSAYRAGRQHSLRGMLQ
jgi:hypothetical protein